MLRKKIKSYYSKIMLHLGHAISKIENTFIGNSEDFEIVMSMFDLLEYSNNYSMASGSLWYDDANENNDAGNYRVNKNKTTTSKSFEYNTKITGSTPAGNNRLEKTLLSL